MANDHDRQGASPAEPASEPRVAARAATVNDLEIA